MSQPRGIRNNNPGNLEWGEPWQGLDPNGRSKDSRFCVFKTAAWGIRAMCRTLITYYDKYGIDTVRGAITRWAPPTENSTADYINIVSAAMGVSPSARLNFHDYDVLRPMIEAIIRHENGPGPLKTPNTWYNSTTIDEGMRLAGVVKPVKSTLMTADGAAAGAAAAAGGAAAVIEIVQQITPAIQQAQAVSTATTGLPSWLRVALIVLTVASAGAAAYALWRKRRTLKAV